MAAKIDSTSSSRRLFLASGAAAAVFGTLHAQAASRVDALIKAHEAAWRVFEDFCGPFGEMSDYDPRYAETQREYKRLCGLEADAMDALLAHKSATMYEVERRGDYLADFLTHGELQPEQFDLLLDSFRSDAVTS